MRRHFPMAVSEDHMRNRQIADGGAAVESRDSAAARMAGFGLRGPLLLPYNHLRMATRRTPSLLESSPWLRNPAERADRILDVAESNGIIEGLPALTQVARQRLHAFLAADSSPESARRE